MDREQLQRAVLARGITVKALDTIVAKVQAHFGETTPKPGELEQFLATIAVWDKIGMSQQQFDALPPDWRLTQARALTPPVVQSRRRVGVEQAVVSPAAILGILITATPVGRSCRGRTVHTG